MSDVDNSLITALQVLSETSLSDVNTIIPGKIISYDAPSNRAVVRAALPKMLANGEPLDAPNVVEVPVLWPLAQNGKAGQTFPIRPGDGVMLAFSQRSLEGWLSGQEVAPDDPRRFDLSDAIAVPGLQARGISPNPDEVQLFFGTTKLRILPGGDAILETAGGNLTIDASGEARFTGPRVRVSGDLIVQGNITTPNDVVAGSVSLRGHVHNNSGGQGIGGTPVQ